MPQAYRGYRLQALYTLCRVLAPANSRDNVFHPEGLEDLDIWVEGRRVEVIQVKSYSNVVLSDLSPSEPNSFFRRAAQLARSADPPAIKLVNFGSVGPEMCLAWEGEQSRRTQVSKKLLQYGFEESDIEALFTHVELVELDEDQEENSVFSLMQSQVARRDTAPDNASDEGALIQLSDVVKTYSTPAG